MTNKQESQHAEDALIGKTLSDAGWKKTVKGEAVGRAEMEFNNGSVTLVAEQGSEPGWLDLSVFVSSEEGSDFSLNCASKLSEVLATIISFQDKISFDNYKQYLTQLLKVCSEVYVDDGDDFVPLIDADGDHAKV